MVEEFKRNQKVFFLNLLQGRYLIIKKYDFFFVAKSISFEVISVLKIRTFAAKLLIL